MTYSEAIDYLYNVAPLFQNIGAGAYKEGLSNTRALDSHFGHPHYNFRTIHIAGTNGKGSCSHTLAAILQSAGYKVGLYTSPHLVDFRERIRVNGKMIPQQRVIDFIEKERKFFEPLCPSFFELTTALAFQYFREEGVDIAVIEVGLGGRLDCTNIITPMLSVITNISYDHTQFLGDTLEKIAGEKAGIIKKGVPVVIGETNGNAEVRKVFVEKAKEMNAPIVFADEQNEIVSWEGTKCKTAHYGTIEVELEGLCQKKNTATILAAVKQLSTLTNSLHSSHPLQECSSANDSCSLSLSSIHKGFSHVCELTGLMGRWQRLQDNPTIICDTGHNPGGFQYIAEQLRRISSTLKQNSQHKSNKEKEKCNENSTIRIVLGMVSDKDVQASLSLLPKEAIYYFTQASVKRALAADKLGLIGKSIGLQSKTDNNGIPVYYPSVEQAYHAVLSDSLPSDFIYIGGSTFVVADLLKLRNKSH